MGVPTGLAAGDTVARAGKYLTFSLGSEHYGVEIARVQEIVGLLPVTRVPRLPGFIAGVVNLRGRVIPVMDLRLSFGMQASAMDERSCIVVLGIRRADGRETVMGAIVDEVSDVVSLSSDAIEPTPEFGTAVDTSFIRGVGRLDDGVVMLLDMDRVLTSGEFENIINAAVAGTTAANIDQKES